MLLLIGFLFCDPMLPCRPSNVISRPYRYLISYGIFFLLVQGQIFDIDFILLKIHTEIIHFLAKTLPPKGVAIDLIWLLKLLYTLGYKNAKLVCTGTVFWFYLDNDAIMFVYNVRNPPCKCRLFINSILVGIIRNLDRVSLFDIF